MKIIVYIKAAIVTGALSLIIWFGMLFARTEILEAFFIEISLFIFLYFGALAFIEEKSPESGNSQSNKEK